MFEYILRKTVYKNYLPRNQDIIVKLEKKKILVEWICEAITILLFVFPAIIAIIIALCKGIMPITRVVVIGLILGYWVILSVFTSYFNIAVHMFKCFMAYKLYFSLYIQKGNAISKKDFAEIIDKDMDLFIQIYTGKCKELSYSTCFKLLKILGKGSIIFYKVKEINTDEKEGEYRYIIQPFYLYRNWLFDPYSRRQYPMEKLKEIYNADFCNCFSYEVLKEKTYKQFKEENLTDLKYWCAEFSSSENWSKQDNEKSN